LYYNDESIAQAGLARYSYLVDGQQFCTKAVMKPKWVDLNIPLNSVDTTRDFDSQVSAPIRVPDEQAVRIVETMAADGRRLFDAPLYRLTKLRLLPRKRFCLRFGLSSYFEYLFTSGMLEDELFQALIDLNLSPSAVMKEPSKYLPCRTKLIPDAESL